MEDPWLGAGLKERSGVKREIRNLFNKSQSFLLLAVIIFSCGFLIIVAMINVFEVGLLADFSLWVMAVFIVLVVICLFYSLVLCCRARRLKRGYVKKIPI